MRVIPLLVGISFVVNVILICRQAVFEKAHIRDRARRGDPDVPLLAMPSLEGTWMIFDRANYSEPGQRVIPWIVAAQVAFVVATVVAAF